MANQNQLQSLQILGLLRLTQGLILPLLLFRYQASWLPQLSLRRPTSRLLTPLMRHLLLHSLWLELPSKPGPALPHSQLPIPNHRQLIQPLLQPPLVPDLCFLLFACSPFLQSFLLAFSLPIPVYQSPGLSILQKNSLPPPMKAHQGKKVYLPSGRVPSTCIQ